MGITLEDLLSLTENGGFTLKHGKRIAYKRGYQVATEGIETRDPLIALNTIMEWDGNAGVWFSQNIFYVDRSHHINDLKSAVEIGKSHNQQSILKWETMELIWL